MLRGVTRRGMRPGAIACVVIAASACLPLCDVPEGCELGLSAADEFPSAQHAAVFTERGISVTRMDVTARTDDVCVLVLGFRHPGDDASVRETAHDMARISPALTPARGDQGEIVHVLLIGSAADGQLRGVGFHDLADAERGMEMLRAMASRCSEERKAGPVGADGEP